MFVEDGRVWMKKYLKKKNNNNNINTNIIVFKTLGLMRKYYILVQKHRAGIYIHTSALSNQTK